MYKPRSGLFHWGLWCVTTSIASIPLRSADIAFRVGVALNRVGWCAAALHRQHNVHRRIFIHDVTYNTPVKRRMNGAQCEADISVYPKTLACMWQAQILSVWVFWVVISCRPEDLYEHFGETHCLHLQTWRPTQMFSPPWKPEVSESRDFVRSEVLPSKKRSFCIIAPCILADFYRRFRGAGHSPDNGGSNVGKLVPYYTAQQHRIQPSSEKILVAKRVE
jgi:hypothetical protein